MLYGKKIISVTPSGRKDHLIILAKYLLDNSNVIDEHHFWVNTTQDEDIECIESLCKSHPNFFKAIYLNEEPDGIFTIHKFFKNCCENDTIYIRFDDDICWIDNNAVSNLITARINNPNAFLVYANTINHPFCSKIHQELGLMSFDKGRASGDGLCDIGWRSGEFGEHVHRVFLEHVKNGNHNEFYFPDVEIPYDCGNRVAINCICWFGEDMADFDGEVGEKEEDWLSIYKPKELKRGLLISGNSLVAHYAYFPQRSHIDDTDVLSQYLSVSGA